jgi:fucose 4-O-acetylase-like acetyltransferase
MFTPTTPATPNAFSMRTDPGPLTRASARRAWVDQARGWGILLVVIGHTLRGLTASGLLPSDGLWAYVDRFIYAFHMPLFFFVSGLFLMPGREESYLGFARRRLLRLGYPYLLWATLQTLVQILLSRYTNHRVGFEELWSIGYAPPMQFWFLYALFLQVLLIGALSKLGLGRGAILGVAALLYVTQSLVPLVGWMPLQQARGMLLYTCLGVFMGASPRIKAIEAGRSALYAGSVVVGFAVVAVFALRSDPSRSDPNLAFVVASCGMLASISLCVLLGRLGAVRISQLLTEWGEASLAIYVAHTLVSAGVRIVLTRAFHVENPAIHAVLGTLLGLTVPWAMFRLCRRIDWPYPFEWPASPRPPRTHPVAVLEREREPARAQL